MMGGRGRGRGRSRGREREIVRGKMEMVIETLYQRKTDIGKKRARQMRHEEKLQCEREAKRKPKQREETAR